LKALENEPAKLSLAPSLKKIKKETGFGEKGWSDGKNKRGPEMRGDKDESNEGKEA